MREQFEKLPEIEALLEYLYFENNHYYSKYEDARDDEMFVDGAWYAFQEQQKKIDVLSKHLNNNYDGFTINDVRELF